MENLKQNYKKYYKILVLASSMTIAAFFTNALDFENDIFVYPVINAAQVIAQFHVHGYLTQGIILFLMYPYWIAVCSCLLPFLMSTRNRLTMIPAPLSKLLHWMIFFTPLIINCYIYFGYYIIPIKNFWIHGFGIALFAVMVFGCYYYFRLYRLNPHTPWKLVLGLTYYTFMGTLAVLMVMVICVYYDILLLFGMYMLFLGTSVSCVTLNLLLKSLPNTPTTHKNPHPFISSIKSSNTDAQSRGPGELSG